MTAKFNNLHTSVSLLDTGYQVLMFELFKKKSAVTRRNKQQVVKIT